MLRNTAVRQRAYAKTETRRQGNSEETPARVLASTRDHAPSDESSFLLVFRSGDFPALPAVPASLLERKEEHAEPAMRAQAVVLLHPGADDDAGFERVFELSPFRSSSLGDHRDTQTHYYAETRMDRPLLTFVGRRGFDQSRISIPRCVNRRIDPRRSRRFFAGVSLSATWRPQAPRSEMPALCQRTLLDAHLAVPTNRPRRLRSPPSRDLRVRWRRDEAVPTRPNPRRPRAPSGKSHAAPGCRRGSRCRGPTTRTRRGR